MGFFSDIFSGGKEEVQRSPATSDFNISTGNFGGGFVEQGAGKIRTELGNKFNQATGLAEEQVIGGRNLLPNFLQQVGRQLGTAQQQALFGRRLQSEADQVTPDSEFNLLQRLLAPHQAQERSALESRLFSQGRLGTTGGTGIQEAQLNAQGQQQQQAALSAIGNARSQQQALRQQAQSALGQALGFGQVAGQSIQGVGQQGLQGLFGLQEASLRPVLAGGSLSGAATNVTQKAPGIGNQAIAGFAQGVGNNPALSTFFSDRRLKQDIELVGRENGHNLYKFSYKINPSKSYIGVMADEVEKIQPSAVITDPSGYKAVYYDMIGIEMREV